jgi:AraC-like DNA-binding protein
MRNGEEDVLGRMLRATHLRGRVFCETTARSPWGIRFEASPSAMFHVVTEGACWLLFEGTKRQLVAGDVVLLPHGSPHALADHPRSPKVPLSEWLASLRRAPKGRKGSVIGSADGPRTRVLCGLYEFDELGAQHPVLRLLPPLIVVPAGPAGAAADLAATTAVLAREHQVDAPGSSLVVARLLEVLFVQIVRRWAEAQPPGGAGWVGALRDTALARVLRAMHDDLGREWSVDELARAAKVSRATLGRRFASEIGEPPLAYLKRARMQETARLLASTDHGLAAIAPRVGYGSEFALSHAFRRVVGVSPGTYRKRRFERAAPGTIS